MDRLLELYFSYAQRLAQCERRIAADKARHRGGGDSDSDDDDDDDDDIHGASASYLRRLDEGGLFSLQRLAVLIGYASCSAQAVRDHVRAKLRQNGYTMSLVQVRTCQL